MAEETIAPCTRPKPECAPEVRRGIFGSFYVYCPRCKSSSRTGSTRAEAIAIWNQWRELDKVKQKKILNPRIKISPNGRAYVNTEDLVRSALKRIEKPSTPK